MTVESTGDQPRMQVVMTAGAIAGWLERAIGPA
jgi:hypothetical protein